MAQKMDSTIITTGFAARLEGREDGTIVIRMVKARNNTSEDGRFQLKYDIEESKFRDWEDGE